MDKVILDNNIFFYNGSSNINFVSHLNEVESLPIDKNIWEISCKTNILDTDFTLDKKVLYLGAYKNNIVINKISNSFYEYYRKIINLKYIINNYAFDFIKDYTSELQISTPGINDWTICIQDKETAFHSNIDRHGSKKRNTIVIGLNENFIGGDFYFKDRIGNDPVRVSHGNVLIFPSNKNYEHMESEVLSGIKYSAVGYF